MSRREWSFLDFIKTSVFNQFLVCSLLPFHLNGGQKGGIQIAGIFLVPLSFQGLLFLVSVGCSEVILHSPGLGDHCLPPDSAVQGAVGQAVIIPGHGAVLPA